MTELFKRLKPTAKHHDSPTVLLLDTSASMDLIAYGDERRIDALIDAVRTTPECKGLSTFEFNNHCYKVEDLNDIQPWGATYLDKAFTHLKSLDFFNIVLITDGEPSNPSAALLAAAGLRLGIIYIGTPPVPKFLQDLAAATDGTFAIEDLTNPKQLAATLGGLIETSKTQKDREGGGT